MSSNNLQIAHSFSSFKRLFNFSKKQHPDFYWGALFSFIKKVLDVAPEILIGVAIDVVVNKDKSFLAKWGIHDAMEQLVLLSILTLVIWVLESIFEYLLLMRWRRMAQSLQHDLRLETYGHLQKLDMAYFEDKSTGVLVSIINDDINQLERFFNEGMNNLIQIATAIILIGSIFFVLAPTIAIFAFLPMPFILFGAMYFQKKAAPLYSTVREKAGLISSRLSNNISGIATIRSFTAEARELKKIAEDSDQYAAANGEAIKVSSRFNPIIRMGVLVGFMSTFVVGGVMTLKGNLDVGSYGVLVFLTQRLLWPMRDLAATVDLFERAMASADRVLNIFNIPVNLEKNKKAIKYNPNEGVKFDHISFAYSNGVSIIEDVSFNVPHGETVAIVGPTGSGKSTITKLLLHFYQATKGSVSLGGIDVKEWPPEELRSLIGLVSQDVFLFHGTIAENIAYGVPNATKEEILAAAKKAYATEFIDRLPQGLDTLIGERGQKLSGGQRQRISIARVILKNPPILILDEATSAVDNETENVIQKSLTEISKGRTTIIIAHRLSTVTHANTIHVLVDGKIAESGSHDELLLQNKTYANLWNLQIRHEMK